MWYPIMQDKPFKIALSDCSSNFTTSHSAPLWDYPSGKMLVLTTCHHSPTLFQRHTVTTTLAALPKFWALWLHYILLFSHHPLPPGRCRWKPKKTFFAFFAQSSAHAITTSQASSGCNSTVNDTHPQGYVLSNLCEGTLGSISNTTGIHWDSKPFLNLRSLSFSRCNGYWQNSFNFKITFV